MNLGQAFCADHFGFMFGYTFSAEIVAAIEAESRSLTVGMIKTLLAGNIVRMVFHGVYPLCRHSDTRPVTPSRK